MNIYDDTPETEPKVKSQLPSKGAAVRVLRSSKEYQNVRGGPRYFVWGSSGRRFKSCQPDGCLCRSA
jgi:hypothetical protein